MTYHGVNGHTVSLHVRGRARVTPAPVTASAGNPCERSVSKPLMITAILWDMDGTMVDSEPLWGIATYELSEKLGRRLTPQLRETTVGGSFANTLAVCATHAGVSVDAAQAKELHDAMFARVRELFDAHLVPRPGVRELLTELAHNDVPMMVTTNTERQLADPSIDAVGRSFFRGSIAGDEVPAPKPAPDMYLAAAHSLGVAPADCLVFEDSAAGMAAAAQAGCRVIGLPEDPDAPLPAGALRMRELCGTRSFEGVRAADVERWYQLFA